MSRLVVYMFLLILCAATAPAFAQGHENKTASAGLVAFDIPSEPLDEALYAYSKTTGIEIIADDALISGRRSTAVKGMLAPSAALRQLLIDSGLTTHSVDPGTFMLIRPEVASAATAPQPQDPYGPYSAVLQDAVVRALCSDDEARPGHYKLAVRLWIGAAGVVEQVALIGSTGDSKRDAAVSRLFNHLSIGHPPPAGMPQPANLLVMPLSPEQTGDCAASERASTTP